MTKKDNDNDIVVEAPELETVFHWAEEEACYKNQFADLDAKIPYRRQIPPEQKRWEDFKSKCIDVNSGLWYTSGDNTGIPKGKEGPKRIVNSILRLKTKQQGEVLQSVGVIVGYNQFGDKVQMPYRCPEQYLKTSFRWETRPNRETGYAMRVNTGPGEKELIYTLSFSKDAAQKLYDLRENDNINFVVKMESQGKVYEVKQPNGLLEDNFKLFKESEFSYLYAANYLSEQQKLFNMRAAESEGLIEKMTDAERAASIAAQKSLSQSDKHIAVQ